MTADNTHVLSNELEEAEFIDQSVWVPKGEEVVPAMLLLNQHVIMEGNRFISTNTSLIDRLLQINLIDQGHHATAQRLVNLYRHGTRRQDYSVMKMFLTPNGYDNSDFCPLSIFVMLTKNLSGVALHWVRVLIGIETCSFNKVSNNAVYIKDTLDRVAEAITVFEDQQAAKRSSPMSMAEAYEYR